MNNGRALLTLARPAELSNAYEKIRFTNLYECLFLIKVCSITKPHTIKHIKSAHCGLNTSCAPVGIYLTHHNFIMLEHGGQVLLESAVETSLTLAF